MQSYGGLRTKLISKEQLRTLSTLQPLQVIKDTFFSWALIISSYVYSSQINSTVVYFLTFVIVGTQYYRLSIIGHDGLHNRLFKDKKKNDLWNDVFILGPVCAITTLNKQNHLDHHKHTAQKDDPDRYKYTHDNKRDAFSYIFFISGLMTIKKSIINVFFKRSFREAKIQYKIRDISIIFGWQLTLIVLLGMNIGWWAYPVLWIAPVYVFAYRADLVRVFCEHSMYAEDDDADLSGRLISFESNYLERYFYAPLNMNFHMVHHLWPSIPYYNLHKADAILKANRPLQNTAYQLIWRKSYTGHIIAYFHWMLKRKTLKQSCET